MFLACLTCVCVSGSSYTKWCNPSNICMGSHKRPLLLHYYSYFTNRHFINCKIIRRWCHSVYYCQLNRRLPPTSERSSSLERWVNKWQMTFNVRKYEFIRITLKKTPILYHYTLYCTMLLCRKLNTPSI